MAELGFRTYARSAFESQRLNGSAASAGVLRVASVREGQSTRNSILRRQSHAEWSEIDQEVMFEDEEIDYFWVLDEARKRHKERKRTLAEKGFIYSDMDW